MSKVLVFRYYSPYSPFWFWETRFMPHRKKPQRVRHRKTTSLRTVSIPRYLDRLVEKVCKQKGMTRTAFYNESLRKYLEKVGHPVK
jgi:hypothetical protein